MNAHLTRSSWLLVIIAAGIAVGVAACGGKTAPVIAPAAATAPSPRPAAPAPAPVPAAAPTVAPGPAGAPAARPPQPAPLIGAVTRAALESYETWKALRAEDYTPDPAAVKAIAGHAGDVKVLMVVATWCPDSKREVPRFFKILDQAGVGLGGVTMVAVDRSKKDAEGLTVKHQILRVPTFVFFRGGQEIGRVTERATTTLENDIAQILAK
jgi:thiol-disulfide isomerase/thioredoxin